ncbi:hypothetical protein ACS5NO_12760 [Larkinella sp. GY13]|uniref:hypothetical protein n=1 Tax=Larkinella sp. GY13 TaxID=3453720 RepID=UPI003EF03E3E
MGQKYAPETVAKRTKKRTCFNAKNRPSVLLRRFLPGLFTHQPDLLVQSRTF